SPLRRGANGLGDVPFLLEKCTFCSFPSFTEDEVPLSPVQVREPPSFSQPLPPNMGARSEGKDAIGPQGGVMSIVSNVVSPYYFLFLLLSSFNVF
ncbi:hypothetical protein TNCV_3677941, partial [Trichonephila clavipes]